MEKTFIRVRSAKDIIITSSLIMAGIFLVTLPDSDSLNILGFFVLFTGLLLALLLKTGYQDEETGERYCKKERFFETCHKDMLSNVVAGRKCKADLSAEDKGNGLRLDIYHSRKSGKAYMQLYEYIPYKYEPCTCMQEHDVESVSELILK